MAGGFTAPNSNSSKMKHGRGTPSRQGAVMKAGKPPYPITDSFASDSIPSFGTRRRKTNNKSGFNTKPSHPTEGGF